MPKQKAAELDWTRATGLDSRDPRFECPDPDVLRQHLEPALHGHMPKWRGNAYASWATCAKCQIRVAYVPRQGATGSYRASGPMPVDVARAMAIPAPPPQPAVEVMKVRRDVFIFSR